MLKLSIIIPVYNEEGTILKIIDRVKKARAFDFKKEIIVVDDFSTDKTISKLKTLNGKVSTEGIR